MPALLLVVAVFWFLLPAKDTGRSQQSNGVPADHGFSPRLLNRRD
jgi:hypothetical protein